MYIHPGGLRYSPAEGESPSVGKVIPKNREPAA